ncbi:hypothetical protein E2C01_011370 [Portunus trituberculatus]|uniref:Uncharacterized protein n=1 Tax=Portunus trituberculatus TaxID=210409 RepID=A0A5B7DAW7_PORTR|nr:hypothetical protein [Portunus trituberculatus]
MACEGQVRGCNFNKGEGGVTRKEIDREERKVVEMKRSFENLLSFVLRRTATTTIITTTTSNVYSSSSSSFIKR